MAEVTRIEFEGKKIVFMSVAGSSDPDLSIRVAEEAKGLIMAEAPKSVLLLTDVTDAVYNAKATDFMKRFSSDVTPHIKASAMVGVSGLRKVIISGLALATGRNIKLFESLDQAKAWLVSQS